MDSQLLRPFRPALITYRHPFLRSDKSGDLQETAHDQAYDQAPDCTAFLIRHQNTAVKSFNWIETSEGLKNDQEHSRRRRKKWRTSLMAGKEVISSPKFQNNLWQTQLYFSFIPSIILLARTSVEVPGTLQKLLEFWTPLHVYKKCPCPPRRAGISCFTSSFPSQYQSEASSLLPSQSSPLSLNLSSLKSSY